MSAEAITDLILEIFRLNGRLLAAGDALVGDLGLTSARWQVMGAVAMAPVPLPVAHVARNMGLTRQTVQRTANELEAAGLVRFAPNPHHQRAKLVLLTPEGEAANEAARRRQRPWAGALADGIPAASIASAAAVLRGLRVRLERGDEPSPARPHAHLDPFERGDEPSPAGPSR
jgi:DNA-binding MarR family transcriptional regulator